MEAIRAGDLRIGNKVLMGGVEIEMDVRTLYAILHGFNGYEPYGIPLTPEVLERANFKPKTLIKSNGYVLWLLEVAHEEFFLIRQSDTSFVWGTIDTDDPRIYDGDFVPRVEVEDLHSLQNLIKAVHNFDLTIKGRE